MGINIIITAIVIIAIAVFLAFSSGINLDEVGNHMFSMETKAVCSATECCDHFVIHDEGHEYVIPRGFDCYEK